MAFKVLLTLLVSCQFFINDGEAATATCEFGPMEGVEGKIYCFAIYNYDFFCFMQNIIAWNI